MLDESCSIVRVLIGKNKLVGLYGKSCLVGVGWEEDSLVVVNASEGGRKLNG